MKRYQILASPTLEDLVTGVNQQIANGWLPLGNVSAFRNDGENEYLQAMIKPKTKEEAGFNF